MAPKPGDARTFAQKGVLTLCGRPAFLEQNASHFRKREDSWPAGTLNHTWPQLEETTERTSVGGEMPVSQIRVNGSSDWGTNPTASRGGAGGPGFQLVTGRPTPALVPSGHYLEVSKLLFEALAAEDVFTNKDS